MLPFELYETDHGIDGWDAKTILKARFSDKLYAHAYLTAREYNHFEYGRFAHANPAMRHRMNQITYEIRDAIMVPEDPK